MSFISLTHPVWVIKKALLNQEPRELGSPSCVLREPGYLQGVSQSPHFLLSLERSHPSTLLQWLHCAGGVSPGAYKLLLELVGPGRHKQATLKCSVGERQIGGGWPRLGYCGLSHRRESGVLAPSWFRCHHFNCSRAAKLALRCQKNYSPAENCTYVCL